MWNFNWWVWNLPQWSEIRCCHSQETTKSPGPENVLVKINRRNPENDEVYLFYFETLRLAYSKKLFYFMKLADYTHNTYVLIS